ncbi:DUF305 domain-containing protein [Nocardia sp. NBC_00508]|uniref:DUF305 domain-containing protein n=1 Tax=Nocardia sp. NBC_00508 TaxID=2975992 RepID=UPI002E81C9A5|nr:DUF305 domain-containing protein [Nocardia sp. NBC_00508]WUD67790.1 DUF305 domain-containing protein [Nocardia sp. NBC_00508]
MAHEARRPAIAQLVVYLGALALLVSAASGAGNWWHAERSHADRGTMRLSSVDIGFAQDMSAHHAQALLLAHTLPGDADRQVRVLADRIEIAQAAEIAMMHGWLLLFDRPLTAPEPMAWMHGTDQHAAGQHHNAASMPGMASIDEIARLGGSHGVEGEILFLQLMIRHHRGGLDMTRAAFDDPLTAEPIRKVALRMAQDQSNEIGVMTAMLTVRHGAALPYP